MRKIYLILMVVCLLGCTQSKDSAKDTDSRYTPKEYVRVKHPDWSKNATIYEVNVRQFTPEGTFRAFESHLPRLKAMGVDIIWQIGRAHV